MTVYSNSHFPFVQGQIKIFSSFLFNIKTISNKMHFNFSVLAFPDKKDDLNLISNFKNEEIKTIIYKKTEAFFQIYDTLVNHEINVPLNLIFKKILLENNRLSPIKIDKESSILLNVEKANIQNKMRVLICSDAKEESDTKFDQKLIFLFKRQNISLDCVTINENKNVNVKLQSAAFYTEGIYLNILSDDELSQNLLQLYYPMPDERLNSKSLYPFQCEEESKLLVCADCEAKKETYILVSDTREIICTKCYRDKYSKNK